MAALSFRRRLLPSESAFFHVLLCCPRPSAFNSWPALSYPRKTSSLSSSVRFAPADQKLRVPGQETASLPPTFLLQSNRPPATACWQSARCRRPFRARSIAVLSTARPFRLATIPDSSLHSPATGLYTAPCKSNRSSASSLPGLPQNPP